MKVSRKSSPHPIDNGSRDGKIPLPQSALKGRLEGKNTQPNPIWLGGVLIEFFDKWIVGISREGVCPRGPVYRVGSGAKSKRFLSQSHSSRGVGGGGACLGLGHSLVVHASE